MMELKFLVFTLVVLFAAFGSIETRWPTGFMRNSSYPSHHRGSYNSSSARRPWATVPPPRYPGGYNSNSGVVLPGQHPGDYNSSSARRPWATVPPPRHHDPSWRIQEPYPRHNYSHDHPGRIANHFYRTDDYSQNNGAGERFPVSRSSQGDNSNSTRLYPSLSGLSESENAGRPRESFGTVPNGPYESENYGNSSYRSG